ncbi:hypothetical protein ACHAW6_011729 [Cyclotella cf. meneghiniana]
MKLSRQSKLLNNLPPTILSPLNTTMPTMATSLTMHSSATAHNGNNDSPTLGLGNVTDRLRTSLCPRTNQM